MKGRKIEISPVENNIRIDIDGSSCWLEDGREVDRLLDQLLAAAEKAWPKKAELTLTNEEAGCWVPGPYPEYKIRTLPKFTCSRHGIHEYAMTSVIPGHEGSWCMKCAIENLERLRISKVEPL